MRLPRHWRERPRYGHVRRAMMREASMTSRARPFLPTVRPANRLYCAAAPAKAVRGVPG